MGGVRRATPPLCPYYSKEVLFTASESTTNEGVRGVAVANAHNELCVLVNAPASQHVAASRRFAGGVLDALRGWGQLKNQ